MIFRQTHEFVSKPYYAYFYKSTTEEIREWITDKYMNIVFLIKATVAPSGSHLTTPASKRKVPDSNITDYIVS